MIRALRLATFASKRVRRRWTRPLLAVALVGVALAGSTAVAAEQQSLKLLESRQAESREKYMHVARRIQLSEERIASLAAQVAKVKEDRAALTAALIQAAKTERKLSEEIEDMAARLEGLQRRRQKVLESLNARRGLLMEVLGALERMGLNPPPAILVRPEDALASVRSAILLGAVVPEMHKETEKLVADLGQLTRVTASIETERNRLEKTVARQLVEKRRLNLLLEKKSKMQAETEASMAEERRKAEEFAATARNLQDLIESLESEIASLQKKIEENRRAQEREAASAVPDTNRLATALPFGERRGSVALPVVGEFGLRFGENDGTGGTLMGDILRTQSGAIVTAPADGTVLYAGPFRSYGQLLILDAGDGYHIVLAGMERISVSLGQSVMAGEPVGTMGETRVASIAALGDGEAAPELYVEIRKGGKPVDPAPWWAERISGRT